MHLDSLETKASIHFSVVLELFCGVIDGVRSRPFQGEEINGSSRHSAVYDFGARFLLLVRLVYQVLRLPIAAVCTHFCLSVPPLPTTTFVLLPSLVPHAF